MLACGGRGGEGGGGGGGVQLWVAFHGADEVHDRQVRSRGGFDRDGPGFERAGGGGGGGEGGGGGARREHSVGCNVFLTTDSLPQLDELGAVLSRAGASPVHRDRGLPADPPVPAQRAAAAHPAGPAPGRGPARGAGRSLSRWDGLEARTEPPPCNGPVRRVAGCPDPSARRARPGVPAQLRRLLRPGRPVPDPARQPARRRHRRGAGPRPRPGPPA